MHLYQAPVNMKCKPSNTEVREGYYVCVGSEHRWVRCSGWHLCKETSDVGILVMTRILLTPVHAMERAVCYLWKITCPVLPKNRHHVYCVVIKWYMH